MIIAGNQRYEAAKANKLKQAPVVILPGLTEAKEKEITIRDNVSNGEWDFEILANEWDEIDLKEWGVGVPDTELHEQKEIELKSFERSHVLISYHPDKHLEIIELIEKISEIPDIEIESTSN